MVWVSGRVLALSLLETGNSIFFGGDNLDFDVKKVMSPGLCSTFELFARQTGPPPIVSSC